MLLSVLLTLIWSGLWARPYPVRLWQIGKADGSSSEFALDGDSYSDISKRFPGCTALYTVGRSSASDVPFVIPPMPGQATRRADCWSASASVRPIPEPH